jgi:HemY protein
MIRVLIFLLLVAIAAFGEVWLADHPGDVAITWMGRRIETSVMVLAVAVAAIAVATTILWSVIGGVLRAPRLLRQRMRMRRGLRAYNAVSQGLVAIGSGDAVAARRFMDEASQLAPNEPLTLLLRAETAQLCGERDGAVRNFELMAARSDTRLLGLHGLFVEARRRNDPAAALRHAEEAAKHTSVPGWAGQAVLEFRCVAGEWSGALDRLERNMKSGLVDRETYRRQRAVLLTAQAIAVEDTDRDRAKMLVLEAVKLAPSLVPAAATGGRLLAEAGETRKAGRIVEAAWCANPHPDLAYVYAHLRPGDAARQRLARIQALAAKSPGDAEAALAVARAALDAQEFAIAREALAPLVLAPTRRVAALMAELEQKQHGDEGRAREWMMRALHARRDPAWTADGFVSERWLPVSPVTGRLDAFEWKDPLAGDDQAGALIEAEAMGMLAHRDHTSGAVPAVARSTMEQRGSGEISAGDPATAKQADDHTEAAAPAQQEDRAMPIPRRSRSLRPIPIPPAVIPLVHAPDDPGPDPEAQSGSETDSSGESADNWSRIRQLFRPQP